MTKSYATIGGVIFAVLLVLFVLATSVVSVEAGHECVVTRNGAKIGTSDPGLSLKPSIFGKLYCIDTRVITYESVREDGTGSSAEHKGELITGTTIDGLDYNISYIVKYRVDPANVYEIFDSYRSDSKIFNSVVKDITRTVVPQELNTFTAPQLYQGNIKEISAGIRVIVEEQFASQGVTLTYFELKKPSFTEAYEQAIEDKALQAEKTEQKILEQKLAEAEAERVRIEAQGVAAATIIRSEQEAETALIVSSTQAESAVIAAQADAQVVGIQAEAEANKKVVAAAAEASRIEQTGAALEANPTVLQWEQIQAIRSANVIYLPSDSGVLPIMNIGESTPTPDE